MNIIDTKLLSFLGSLKLLILTDEGPPDREELQYENQGDIWYAEQDGWVDFFKASGSGGLSRTITTKEGEERSFTGVGASRCGIVNDRGLGPCVKVKYTTDRDEFERSNGINAFVTLEVAEQAAKKIDATMEKETDRNGEVTWVPKRSETGK